MSLKYMILQLLVAFAIAPLFDGICRNLRGKIQSRRGYPVLQTYFDLIKLLRRGRTAPNTAGWFFRVAPFLLFGFSALLVMLIPLSFTSTDSFSNLSNIFVIVYLLAAWRFVFGVASVESGNPFAVVGAGRECLISLYVEPVLIICLIVVGFHAGSTNLVEIRNVLFENCGYVVPSFCVAAVAFLWACFVETGRKPFDIAEADQEVQEGVLAEYSGRDLALFETAMILKQWAVLSFFVSLFVPLNLGNEFLNLLANAVLVAFMTVGGVLIDNFGPRFRIISSLKFKSGCMIGVALLSLGLYVVGA